MIRRFVGIGVLAATLAFGGVAYALGSVHGKGDPQAPISASHWPQGVAALVNRTDRVGGFWVNWSDEFFYQGDARAFNAFLRDYASLGLTPRKLVIQELAPTIPFPDTPTPPMDWALSVTGVGPAVSVTLPLDGRIKLRDVKLPPEFQVAPESLRGAQKAEVERFIMEQARR